MFVQSAAGEVIGLLTDYLLSELPLDIENVHKGATTLRHLKRTLATACQGLNRSVTTNTHSIFKDTGYFNNNTIIITLVGLYFQ